MCNRKMFSSVSFTLSIFLVVIAAFQSFASGSRPLCENGKLDAIFYSRDGKTYSFQGDHYYAALNAQLGAAARMSDRWPNVPSNIDAAFEHTNGTIYFFKDNMYWCYETNGNQTDIYSLTKTGTSFLPNQLDAVLFRRGDSKLYAFKGDKYWRYDLLTRKLSEIKNITNLDGVPYNIDAAMHNGDGYMYFYKNNKYYRFNENILAVDQHGTFVIC